MRQKDGYVLAISSTWPPMPAGSGRAFKELISGIPKLIALVPRTAGLSADLPGVRRVLRFSGRGGGPLKIYSAFQHCEVVVMPILWCLFSGMGIPRLVLCNLPLFAGFAGLLIRTFWGVPYLVEGHGEEFTTALERRFLFRWRYRLTRLILHKAAIVVCNAGNTQTTLNQHYGLPCQKLLIMKPTLDTSERSLTSLVEALATRKRLVGDGFMVLMVGRLSQIRKGFDRALESFPLVLHATPSARLVIVGPGETNTFRALARDLGIGESVIFTGEVDRKQLLTLYAACDVFLLPARTMPDGDVEGFGIVYLEANMFGKPVIGGRTGGTDEAIVDGVTGLLIDANSPRQIAEATVRLLVDPDYAMRLGRQGQERVLREFDSQDQQMRFAGYVEKSLLEGVLGSKTNHG